jgi:hypothetical protein
MISKKLIFAFVFILHFFFSCKQENHNATKPKYKPSSNVKPKGKYYYTMVNETVTKLELSEKRVENTNNTTLDLFTKQ